MYRTCLTLLLALAIVCAPLAAPAFAQETTQATNSTPPQGQAKQVATPAQPQPSAPLDKGAEKIKRVVSKIGVGERLTVFLKNGNDLHGTVSYISETNFDVAEVDMHRLINVQYTEVKKVREGYSEINLLTGKRHSRPKGLGIAAFAGMMFFAIGLPLILVGTAKD